MSNNRKSFLNRYSGEKLLEKYNISTEGIWRVTGEDPNCDMGGCHSQPFLGYYKGRLDEVINIAVDLSGFWQWGAGGSIELISINDIQSKEYIRQKEVKLRIRVVEKQLAALKDELAGV